MRDSAPRRHRTGSLGRVEVTRPRRHAAWTPRSTCRGPAPIPTPEVLWRKPPVLALAALPGTALGRLGEPSTASAAAWAAAGAAARMLHDAPPPWPGRSPGNAAPVSQGMTSGELVASLRQIDGQRDKGKHPPNFHFRWKPFLHFHNGPDRTYADVGSAGTSSRSPHQRRSNERFCWSR
jgi:hypothetical protein